MRSTVQTLVASFFLHRAHKTSSLSPYRALCAFMPILLRVDPGWGIREVWQTTLGPKENKRELRSIRIISIPRPFVNPISLFLTMLTHFLPLGLPNFVPHFVSPKGDLRLRLRLRRLQANSLRPQQKNFLKFYLFTPRLSHITYFLCK